MKTVAVVAFDRVAIFELAVPCEVFGIDRSAGGSGGKPPFQFVERGHVHSGGPPEQMGVPNYSLLVCAAEPGPLRAGGGFTIQPRYGLRALARADTIVVPAWRDIDETPPEPLLAALRRAHDRGARIASLCSGAFVLAHAGLLDGRRATTHWMYSDALAERFPRVDVDCCVLYVDEGSVLTSAGTAAGIDLCLHMVRKDYGAEVANVFARRMVVPPHRDGGQAQFIEAPVPLQRSSEGLGETLAWITKNIHRPLTVDHMARRARMAPRTFARHFRSYTGTTPLRWLLAQRVRAAQRLLETTDLPVEQVAEKCGFGSSAALRAHFGEALGTSPIAYRRTFRASA